MTNNSCYPIYPFYLFQFLLFALLFHSSTSSNPLAPSPSPSPSLSPSPSPSPGSNIKTFNVVATFGAKNDSKTDSTKSFQNAWNAACASPVPSQIYVPHGTYLIRSIIFNGSNCNKSSVYLRIDGTLAPYNVSSDLHWIVFQEVHDLHIMGGVLDAKGKNIWDCKKSGSSLGKCPLGAKSLSFENSTSITVDGLTSRDSQMFHITIDGCNNINMADLTITADGDSPNTDGIHIARSNDITIKHSQMMTGDDCISIGPNTHDIWIENVFCGPGHGISIGSLGRVSEEGLVVKNVTVKEATFVGTDNGLRIKTFASPVRGIVTDINYLGAYMVDVHNPIIIDQNYCPHGICPRSKALQGSAVQISNVYYKSIHGTTASPQIVTFDCSPVKPCSLLKLEDVRLSDPEPLSKPKCVTRHALWKIVGPIQPSSCLVA